MNFVQSLYIYQVAFNEPRTEIISPDFYLKYPHRVHSKYNYFCVKLNVKIRYIMRLLMRYRMEST